MISSYGLDGKEIFKCMLYKQSFGRTRYNCSLRFTALFIPFSAIRRRRRPFADASAKYGELCPHTRTHECVIIIDGHESGGRRGRISWLPIRRDAIRRFPYCFFFFFYPTIFRMILQTPASCIGTLEGNDAT